jgi:hypothetical protein
MAWRANASWFPPDGPAGDPGLRGGGEADLVSLSSDPFSVPRDSLVAVRVLATLRAGKPVFVDASVASLFGVPR